MAQKNSMAERLYSEPQYESLIRLIGYEGIELAQYEPHRVALFKKYGTKKATEAIRALVQTDLSRKPVRICLKKDIRSRVWPILGPDPIKPPWWVSSTAPQKEAGSAKPKPSPRKKLMQREKKTARTLSTCRRKS